MKIVDAVKLLLANLPKHTSYFFDDYTITALTRSNTTVTATTSAPHNLIVNQCISIVGAFVKNPIVSLTQENGVATAVTQNPHDLTEGWQDEITIIGADQAGYNGDHLLLTVPNRKTFTFSVDESTISPATGTPFLLDDNSYLNGFNGFKIITSIPTATTFTYELSDEEGSPPLPYSPAYGSITGKTNHRIAGFLNYDIASQWYNEKALNSRGLGKYWLLCVPDGAITSKSRWSDDDAVNNTTPGQVYRERLVNQFSLYVFAPLIANAGTDMFKNGREIIDTMADEILAALIKSIGRYKFPSPFYESTWSRTAFVSHAHFGYNDAFSVHRFIFENTQDVIYEDTIEPDDNVALRDLYFNYTNPLDGDVIASAYVNTDDVPLP